MRFGYQVQAQGLFPAISEGRVRVWLHQAAALHRIHRFEDKLRFLPFEEIGPQGALRCGCIPSPESYGASIANSIDNLTDARGIFGRENVAPRSVFGLGCIRSPS